MPDDRQRLLDEHESHYGGLDILRWGEPRVTIAPQTKGDDLAYSLAGMWQASAIIRTLDMRPSELARLTLFDVGCGTGKVTRAMAPFTKSADGWDPYPKCVEVARAETARCPFVTVYPVMFHEVLPTGTYGLIICTDVVPSLDRVKLDRICDQFGCLARKGTKLVVNVQRFREPLISRTLKLVGFRPNHRESGEAVTTQDWYSWEKP